MEGLFAASLECAQVAVPEATEQAMRFYRSGNLLWIVQNFWSLLIPFLFLYTGFTGKLASFSYRLGKNWFFSLEVYLILFLLIMQILSLPIDFYGSFVRMHEYGLSTQTFGKWLGDYGKGTGVTLVGALAFVWIFYLLLRKSPRRWWFYSSLVSIGITFFTVFIQPIWIDPLFNDFGPMKNKQLESQILSLAARAGIENSRVYEVDKSADTTLLNAYVTGLGSSRRIVLWDTTIQQMTPRQILFVMGHEMGHYVLHHVWWFIIYSAVLSFLMFYLIYRTASYLLERYGSRFGVTHLASIGSVPLLLLLMTFFSLLTTPLSNYVSRYMEREADRFGLEITEDNQAAAEAFIVLQKKNLGNPRPGPVFTFWRSTHPSLGSRIDFANSYCPWKRDEPSKYSDLFKVEGQ
jgi:Zn-dependent protease with chaperone function